MSQCHDCHHHRCQNRKDQIRPWDPNPAPSRSSSRSPKDRTPEQPAASSKDPGGSSHAPTLPLKQDRDNSDLDRDATQ
eukprot:11692781-Karenia_brevis.AAC.1